MIRVVHYMRRTGAYGVEGLYRDIRAHMPPDISVTACVSRFPSRGILPRLYDIFRAGRHQGDINHVTGDVHFLTYLLRKRRTILTIHDCGTLENVRGLKKFLLWLLWYWVPEKRSAAIVVVSEATKQNVLRHLRCDASKLIVIHNHVADEFRPSPRPFNQEAPRVLVVGTTANKNIERTAQALGKVNCHVVVIGHLSGSQIAALHQCCPNYENYVDISRATMVEQYRRSDMVVFASTYEGFGFPIVEANAVGRPVVTANVTSMPEVAGDAACLVDPFDISSIRAGVLRVIGDAAYREYLVARGFENVMRFRIEAVAAQYAELYRNVHSRLNQAQ
jgi:glycosyltransferase involved in cell wall biosynthesis